ncbi:MAG: hypothetical protein FIA99_08390 [Ruminiclostridium sp.]|nr:hypothetical protein [Ruminiclostridium sp.]
MKLRCIVLLILLLVTISACDKTSKSDNNDIEFIKNSTIDAINDSVTIGYAIATANFPKTEWESKKGENGQPVVIVKTYPYKVENGKLGKDTDKSTYVSFQFEVDQDKKVQITSCGRYKADGTIVLAGKREECNVNAYTMYFASHKKPEQ